MSPRRFALASRGTPSSSSSSTRRLRPARRSSSLQSLISPEAQLIPRRRVRSGGQSQFVNVTDGDLAKDPSSAKRSRPEFASSPPRTVPPIVPAEGSPDRLRIDTSAFRRRQASPGGSEDVSPISGAMALPPNWPHPPRPLGWSLVGHGHAAARTPEPIDSPADPHPFPFDDALVSVATQRFDSLGLPVDPLAPMPTASGFVMPIPTFNEGHHYAPLSPDYKFPAPSSSASIHSSGPTPMPAQPNAADLPNWWPYRAVRVRRDDAAGVPLAQFLAELAAQECVPARRSR